MQTLLGRVFSLFLALALCPSAAFATTTDDVSLHTGGVFVTTLPNGADAWVDGVYAGHTPLLVDALSEGRHTISLTREGWSVSDLDITVSAGKVLFETIAMARYEKVKSQTGGTLSLRGIPAGAHVAIDGKPVTANLNEPITLDAGAHEVTIQGRGSGASVREFSIYPETSTYLIADDQVQDENRSTVVAPAETYLPDGSYIVDGTNFRIHYGGHHVIGKLNDPAIRVDGVVTTYDVAPSLIRKQLYLPLKLLVDLTE